MEISDYIGAVRRRIWIVVLLPLLAGIATAGALYTRPLNYEGQATVIAPSLSAKGYSTSAVTQYVSTYKDVLNSTPLLDSVARQLHLSEGALVGTLSASTATASSNIIQVTYAGPDRKLAPAIARTAAIDALDDLVAPQLAAANAAVGSSQGVLNQANQALSAFTTQTGLLDPTEAYRLKELELSQLMVQLEEARLAGDGARTAGLQTIVAERQQELTSLSASVQRYQQLSDERSSATSNHNHATQTLSDVNAVIASNHAPGSVSARPLGHVSRIPTLARYGVTAAAVALLLCLAYLLLLETVRSTSRTVPHSIRVRPGLAPAPVGLAGERSRVAVGETKGHTLAGG